MINLLPPERSQNIRYSRMNFVLLKWLAGSIAAVVILVFILFGGNLYISQQSNNLQSEVNDSKKQLASQDLPKVQKDADEISGDVKVINQILGKEVRFSDLLQTLGQVMPSGTVLNSLSLTSVNGAIDLSVNATSSATAAQIPVNLTDPTVNLFTKVDIVSINCTPIGTSGSTYPCNATFKALFSKNAESKYAGLAKAASNGQ